MIMVIRARRDIRPRSVISLDSLEEVALPDLAFDPDAVGSMDQAVGKVARNLIFQGRAIKQSDLEEEEFRSAS